MYEALYWTMLSHTRTCTAKSPCVDKRENRALPKLTDIVFFFWTLPIDYFVKESSPRLVTGK